MSKIPKKKWENFDAEKLFPPPRIHSNKIVKIDEKDLNKVDQDDLGDFSPSPSQEMEEPQDGDSYTDVPLDKGHVDELFEMEGLEGGQPDEREVKADKEIDNRQESEANFDKEEANDDSEGQKQPQQGQGKSESEEGEKSEPSDEEEESPIQGESEEIEELVEATFETSEDVHGGNEATKDIEDSPNAADDGENPENKGAESGQDGDGEGDGDRSNEDDTGNSDSEGQAGSGEGEAGEANSDSDDAEGEVSGNPFDAEDWEKNVDHSANKLQLENNLKELEAKMRNETGHRTTLPSYDFNREDSPVELEVAFKKGRELIQKFAAEEDFTTRIEGQKRWDAKRILKNVVSFRHSRIPSSKYERPREADIVLLLDISGSCAQQAEMFMAIAAGAIGNGVTVCVGYNGDCRTSPMKAPKKKLRSYRQAKAWVQEEMERLSGWENSDIGDWNFWEFVENVKPKTLIIFGDWDGIDQYQNVVPDPKFRRTKFYWFCNEGYGRRFSNADEIPHGFSKKNYFPGVYVPRDLIRTLKRVNG